MVVVISITDNVCVPLKKTEIGGFFLRDEKHALAIANF